MTDVRTASVGVKLLTERDPQVRMASFALRLLGQTSRSEPQVASVGVKVLIRRFAWGQHAETGAGGDSILEGWWDGAEVQPIASTTWWDGSAELPVQ